MIQAAHRKADMIRASLAASPGFHTFEEVLADITSGRCVVLEGVHAVMVLEIVPPSLNAWIVGGDKAEIFALLPGAEALARAMGMTFASFGDGRRAWRRVLAPYGYRAAGDEFRKAL